MTLLTRPIPSAVHTDRNFHCAVSLQQHSFLVLARGGLVEMSDCMYTHCRYRVSRSGRRGANSEAHACQLGFISIDDELLSCDKHRQASVFQCDSTISQYTDSSVM